MGSILRSIASQVPTVVTFAVLGGIFFWGHQTGWRLAKPSATTSTLADEWCPEHHVAESVCILCRKNLGSALTAQEPAQLQAKGEKTRFAQVASTEVLLKSGIDLAPVEFASLAPRLRMSGETMYPPESVARLASRSAGVVQAIVVHLGDHVAAGDLVAVVESADVGRAKSALMLAVTQLDLAKGNAQRARLTAAAGIRSQADVEELESRLRSAEVGVFDAGQSLRNFGFTIQAGSLAGLDAATLAVRLRHLGLPASYDDGGSASLLPLRAPRAGMVTGILAVTGEAVEAYAPLVIVADTTSVRVELPLAAELAQQVTVGQAVEFTPAGGKPVAGAITAISQSADPVTRLVTVWAHLPNPEQHLRVGIFGSATITTGAPVTAAVVPPRALQYDGDQAYVFVQRSPTIFRALPVRILARDGEVLLVDRLAAGEVIAIAGTGTLFAIAFLERLGAGCCAVE